ncbi:MAG: aminoglycoside phosphotransferase family protein [Rhodobacter sp.]|nr:aminoglycoside phosphotransferase family protein [Rhodobacter sp.]
MHRLAELGLAPRDLAWQRLGGGRTNCLWRCKSTAGDLVCKLYDLSAATPLFGNEAAAEAQVLTALSGTGLAPELVVAEMHVNGAFLVYRHLSGTAGTGSVTACAQLLARVHQHPPPAGLRRAPQGASEILQQGETMRRSLSAERRKRLATVRPETPKVEPMSAVLLHGDPVPANFIATGAGLRLIDWQCPSVGDPAEDLAIFLSPAMQSLYGEGPLSKAHEAAFLEAYGHPDRAARYRALASAFYWRMAAYCFWKAERGAVDYAAAAELDLAMLDRAGHSQQPV